MKRIPKQKYTAQFKEQAVALVKGGKSDGALFVAFIRHVGAHGERCRDHLQKHHK